MAKPAITVICRLCSSPAVKPSDNSTTPIHICAIITHIFTFTTLIPEIPVGACTSYEYPKCFHFKTLDCNIRPVLVLQYLFFTVQVFRCLPLDSIRNLHELQEHVNAQNLSLTDPEKAKEELQDIHGILVHFPLHFLCEEYLLPPFKSKERMVPMEVWT